MKPRHLWVFTFLMNHFRTASFYGVEEYIGQQTPHCGLSLQGPRELSLDFPNPNAAFHQSKQTCHPSHHPLFFSQKNEKRKIPLVSRNCALCFKIMVYQGQALREENNILD